MEVCFILHVDAWAHVGRLLKEEELAKIGMPASIQDKMGRVDFTVSPTPSQNHDQSSL